MTAPNDFWSEFSQSGDFVKFDNVGDSIAGTITAVRRHMFEDGKVVPQVELDTADGPKTLTAGQVRLKALFAEKRPNVGDYITVTLTDIEKRQGGKTIKSFNLVVGPQSAPAPTPAPAADPLAGMDPAQIAALAALAAQQQAAPAAQGLL